LAALRWGVPSGSLISKQPLLVRLMSQFERFVEYLHDQLGWPGDVPAPISFDEFSTAHTGTVETSDVWACRFLRLSHDMGRLSRVPLAHGAQESYTRYREWLPFAYRCEQARLAVSRDLDYQPMLRTKSP
jgi:hypothetical protein